ncbi:MAG: hypothetical protein RL767_313 [Bacteroidota bacterium]
MKFYRLHRPNRHLFGILKHHGLLGAGPNGRVEGKTTLICREKNRDFALLYIALKGSLVQQTPTLLAHGFTDKGILIRKSEVQQVRPID